MACCEIITVAGDATLNTTSWSGHTWNGFAVGAPGVYQRIVNDTNEAGGRWAYREVDIGNNIGDVAHDWHVHYSVNTNRWVLDTDGDNSPTDATLNAYAESSAMCPEDVIGPSWMAWTSVGWAQWPSLSIVCGGVIPPPCCETVTFTGDAQHDGMTWPGHSLNGILGGAVGVYQRAAADDVGRRWGWVYQEVDATNNLQNSTDSWTLHYNPYLPGWVLVNEADGLGVAGTGSVSVYALAMYDGTMCPEGVSPGTWAASARFPNGTDGLAHWPSMRATCGDQPVVYTAASTVVPPTTPPPTDALPTTPPPTAAPPTTPPPPDPSAKGLGSGSGSDNDDGPWIIVLFVVLAVAVAAVLRALVRRGRLRHKQRNAATAPRLTRRCSVSDHVPPVMNNPLYRGAPTRQLGPSSSDSTTDDGAVNGHRVRSNSTLSTSSRTKSYDVALNAIGIEAPPEGVGTAGEPVSPVYAIAADKDPAATEMSGVSTGTEAEVSGTATATLPDYKVLQPSYGVPLGAGAMGEATYAALGRNTRAGVLGDRLADVYAAASTAKNAPKHGAEYSSPAELTRVSPAGTPANNGPEAKGYEYCMVPAGGCVGNLAGKNAAPSLGAYATFGDPRTPLTLVPHHLPTPPSHGD